MVEHATGKNVADGFDGDARSIGALHGSARGKRNVRLRLQAMAEFGPLTGARLLDVGCGTGEYTRILADSYDQVDGIDVELDRIEVFRRDLPANVTVGLESVNDLSFDDDTFDTVTMIEVLEHLADPPAAMSEIRRVLKPGGRLLLTTPNRLWPFEQHGVAVGGRRYPGVVMPGLVWIKPLHERISNSAAFTRRDLQRLADGAGLTLLGVTYMMPPLDSLPEGHVAHRVSDRAADSPARLFGQTIVGGFQK